MIKNLDFPIVTYLIWVMIDLDNIDRRLIIRMQENARTPIAKLAEFCAASTASIQRRLRRLRQTGVIIGDTISVDRLAVGFSVKAVISVELERDKTVDINAFKETAIKEPYVQHCYCIAGEVDFILIVVAKNMIDYEAFTHRFFFSNRNVRKFKTSIVVSEQKATNAVPLWPVQND